MNMVHTIKRSLDWVTGWTTQIARMQYGMQKAEFFALYFHPALKYKWAIRWWIAWWYALNVILFPFTNSIGIVQSRWFSCRRPSSQRLVLERKVSTFPYQRLNEQRTSIAIQRDVAATKRGAAALLWRISWFDSLSGEKRFPTGFRAAANGIKRCGRTVLPAMLTPDFGIGSDEEVFMELAMQIMLLTDILFVYREEELAIPQTRLGRRCFRGGNQNM